MKVLSWNWILWVVVIVLTSFIVTRFPQSKEFIGSAGGIGGLSGGIGGTSSKIGMMFGRRWRNTEGDEIEFSENKTVPLSIQYSWFLDGKYYTEGLPKLTESTRGVYDNYKTCIDAWLSKDTCKKSSV